MLCAYKTLAIKYVKCERPASDSDDVNRTVSHSCRKNGSNVYEIRSIISMAKNAVQ